MTSSRPTSAIRRRTRTVRSTASTGATTVSSLSIRRRARRRRCASRCSTRACPQASRKSCRSLRPTGAATLLVRSRHHESCRDGPQGTHLDVVALSPTGGSTGVLRESSLGEARAARDELSPDPVLRPAHEAVSSSRHLLRYAPRAVRRRRGRDSLRQRRLQRRARLGQHAGAGGDRRRGQGARLVHAVLRRERRRQDRARRRQVRVRGLPFVGRHARGIAGAEGDLLQRDSRTRPTAASGAPCRARCRAASCASTRRLAFRKSTSRRSTTPRSTSTATRRAASTSTATA